LTPHLACGFGDKAALTGIFFLRSRNQPSVFFFVSSPPRGPNGGVSSPPMWPDRPHFVGRPLESPTQVSGSKDRGTAGRWGQNRTSQTPGNNYLVETLQCVWILLGDHVSTFQGQITPTFKGWKEWSFPQPQRVTAEVGRNFADLTHRLDNSTNQKKNSLHS